MKLIINAFNPYVGRYQTPVTVNYKKKFNGSWSVRVEYPAGGKHWLDLATVERDAICKINLRKLKTAKTWSWY